MNLLITGPQASGKGTQARLLVKEFGLYHMENGTVLRNMAKTDRRLKNMMNEGILVPDQEMIKIMEEHIEENHKSFDNIIFDGYPRTVSQYVALKDWLQSKGTKLDFAVVINISTDESVRRMSARRVHSKTGEIYNLLTKPPVGIPEEELIQREDDKPDSIKKRLSLYNEKTKPLIDLYKKDGILVAIDGERSIDDIQSDIVEKLKSLQ